MVAAASRRLDRQAQSTALNSTGGRGPLSLPIDDDSERLWSFAMGNQRSLSNAFGRVCRKAVY